MLLTMLVVYLCILPTVLIQQVTTSPLGTWLRAPEGTPPPRRVDNLNVTKDNPRQAVILVWKYGRFLERRHLQRFQEDKRFSPWDDCSVNDCRLSYDPTDILEADAVLFYLHRMTKKDAKEIALWERQKRRPEQLWIFLTDESPMHTVIHPEYNGLFNWSMNYRSDSDVPVAYGRTIRSMNHKGKIKIDDRINNKTKLVAVMGSNCSGQRLSGSKRWKYIELLGKYLPGQLDIYGRCLNGNTTACPGHFAADCPLLNDYKFYLAFENSNCLEYLTEKVFWNAYSKFSIPVIMGPPRSDCNRLLPPRSFLHIDDFSSPYQLAHYLRYLDRHRSDLLDYHAWRADYIVLNEHGYFGSRSRHYCRICEALRYNPTQIPKTYWDLERYWRKQDCSVDYANFF